MFDIGRTAGGKIHGRGKLASPIRVTIIRHHDTTVAVCFRLSADTCKSLRWIAGDRVIPQIDESGKVVIRRCKNGDGWVLSGSDKSSKALNVRLSINERAESVLSRFVPADVRDYQDLNGDLVFQMNEKHGL